MPESFNFVFGQKPTFTNPHGHERGGSKYQPVFDAMSKLAVGEWLAIPGLGSEGAEHVRVAVCGHFRQLWQEQSAANGGGQPHWAIRTTKQKVGEDNYTLWLGVVHNVKSTTVQPIKVGA